MGNLTHPVGYISMHAGDHDAYGVIRAWIMTDLGWRLADGSIYDRSTYPRLWDALPGRRTGDFVEVPDMRAGRVELQPHHMPSHTHTHSIATPLSELRDNARFDPYFMQRQSSGYVVGMDPGGQFKPVSIYKQQRIDRRDVIGHVESARTDDTGLHVRMRLDDHFTELIKKSMVDTANLESLFPEFHGIKGMKWGERRTSTSTTKENNMSGTRTLQTPSKNIKRKDLTVALRLVGYRAVDDLFDVVALVQSVGDNEKVFRANELKAKDVVGKYVRIHGRDEATGGCSDFVKDELRDYATRIVLDGKLETINGDDYLIVSEIEAPAPKEPLGNDTLRMVGR